MFSENKNDLLILKKCTFCTNHVVFWDLLSAKGVQVDGKKIKAIQEWPTPKTVRDFSTLAAPFNEIVKKHVRFKWEEK